MAGNISKEYFNPRIRAAFTMSSWYCIPEEKMLDLEILSRASAFLIKAKKPSFGRKFHVVTVSHSIAPWRWPKYYPQQDWIQGVNEKHTHYTFEIRAPTGAVQTQIECIPRSYHHKTKDLAVLHIGNEKTLIEKLFEPMALSADYLLPSIVSQSLTSDNELEFQGHDLSQSDFNPGVKQVEDIRVPMPCSTNGFITLRTKRQNFAFTETPITDGMYGGPILTRRSLLNTQQLAHIDAAYPVIKRSAAHAFLPKDVTDTRYIVGMMDGIVSPTNDNEDLRGMASFIDAADIDSFLDAIENEEINEVVALVGGEAAKHVASDPDPEKRDLAKVFKGCTD